MEISFTTNIFRSKGKRVRNLNLRNYSKVDWPRRQRFDLVKLNFNQRRAICCINVSLIGESSSLHIFLVVPKAMAPAVSPLRHIVFVILTILFPSQLFTLPNFIFYTNCFDSLFLSFYVQILIIFNLFNIWHFISDFFFLAI